MGARFGKLVLVGLAVGQAASAQGAGARGGRVEVVEHRRSEMVRVPAGPFVRGFVGHDQEGGEEARDDASRECMTTVGAGGARYCSGEFIPLHYAIFIPVLYLTPWGNAIPRTTVYLSAFEIDRYEATVAEYRECVAAGACDSGPLVQGDQRYHRDPQLPIGNLTWQDASEYCRFRHKRLPSEAEWEKAARSDDGRRWPWGNQSRTDGGNFGTMSSEAVRMTAAKDLRRRTSGNEADFEIAPDDRDGFRYAAPPGAMRWSESYYGAFDMAGNVAEWVADYYSIMGYGDLPAEAPVRTIPQQGDRRRVIRGGSWLDLPLAGRTYARSAADPGLRSPRIGVRCARDSK